MPLLRTILVSAAKHAASDPRVRAAAAQAFNQHLRPRATAAWQRGRPRVAAAARAGAQAIGDSLRRTRKSQPR